MDDVEKFLKQNTGFCVFPIVGPDGKRKRLCNAMTFQENGRHQPFCKEHAEEIKRIWEYRKTLRNKKKRGFKVKGGV